MIAEAGIDRRLLVARHASLRGIDGATVVRRNDVVDVDLHFIPAAAGVGKRAAPDRAELRDARVRLEGSAARGWSVRTIAPSAHDPLVVRVVLVRASGSGEDDPRASVVLRLSGVRDLAAPFDAVRVRLADPSSSSHAVDPVRPSPIARNGAPSAEIDYVVKDYAGFRQAMLDRLARTEPAWTERHAADVGIVMVELLAYAADYLSYYQDTVATDAYLATARRRTSVRRHARALGYRLHDGCAPRTWLHFDVVAPVTIAPELPVTTKGEDASAHVYRTLEAMTCRTEHNALVLYDFGEDAYELSIGATRATLLVEDGDPTFADGDVLVLEQCADPQTGRREDADPRLRQAVRLRSADVTVDPLTGARTCEIVWDERDALTFPLVAAQRVALDGRRHERLAHALGNIVPAEYGAPVRVDPHELPLVGDATRAYRPRVLSRDLTFAVPYDPLAERLKPARALTALAPEDAVPAIVLDQYVYGDRTRPARRWVPVRDLLAARPDARAFVVETENDGSVALRFGDGVHARAPEPGSLFVAHYRAGNGPQGHVGPDTLTQTSGREGVEIEVLDDPRTHVRNPLHSQGGVAPQPIDEARREAPAAIRTQQRCVVDDDYIAAAKGLDLVRAAAIDRVFTGSWPTVRLFVQRIADGGTEDEAFLAHVRAALEPLRLINVDLAVLPPVFVPIETAMTVTCAPDAERQAVHVRVDAAVAAALGAEDFTFGQSVYASPLIAAAMSVHGVRDAVVTRLARLGAPPAAPTLEPPAVTLRGHEIARVGRCLLTSQTGPR